MIEVGPLTLAWHGLTVALGVAVGAFLAGRYAKRRGLDPEPLFAAVLWLVVAGIAGARFVYLAENDAAALLAPGEWLDARGFSFYGGMVFGALAAGASFWRRGLHAGYLDALAVGFPVGMAVGRIGDLINGEHYGTATDAPWGVRYTHPAAEVPTPDVAYHQGGLYEIVLALLIAGAVLGLHRYRRKPGDLLWMVVGLYGAGRFVMFFYRVDSAPLALGLDTSQWISIALVAVALSGLYGAKALRALRRLRPATTALIATSCLVVSISACSDDEADQAPEKPPPPAATIAPDPGPIHVHGLGVNPADGSLMIASHTGLYRVSQGRRPVRVGDYQDTMAFEVLGPDRFLGSGHPGERRDLPPYLGLIESRDGGRTWRPRSLQGKMDFHLLQANGRRIYGFGSDFKTRRERLLASDDGGRTWTRRAFPEPFVSLVLDPGDARHLVASGRRGLYRSRSGGRKWRRMPGAPGLLAWSSSGRLFSVDQRGVVAVSAARGRSWQATGTIGGKPAAFASARGAGLVVALHDGTVKQSSNGGSTWRVRSRPE